MSAMVLQPLAVGGSSPNSDLGRTKGKRKSKPKVKTGCLNCKQRRIKCDEGRPHCNNCVKSKRECAGYPPPPRRANFEVPTILPKPAVPSIAPAVRPAAPIAPTHTPGPQTQLARRVKKHQMRIHQQFPTSPITPPNRASPIPQIPLPQATQGQNHLMQLQHLSRIVYQPAILQLNNVDAMYLQLFTTSTANELSGYFDAGFWTKSVLQGAEIEPAIRHAVVALGALYKTLEKSTESPPSSPHTNLNDTPSHHWQVAISQYAHAVTEMRRFKEMERQSMRTQLMANVLLACFDSFVGAHQQAIMQIKNGLHLLELLRQSHRNQLLPTSQEPLDEDLVHMFTRLAIQAKTYDMAFHFPEPHVVRLVPQLVNNDAPPSPLSDPEPPSPSLSSNGVYISFTTLVEARIAWDKLVYKIFRFTEMGFQSTNAPMGLLHSDIKRYGLSFHQQLKDWAVSFESLFQSRHNDGITPQVKAGMATLKMTYIMSYILFVMTFQFSELDFDNYKDSFQEIINLALEVVGDQERRAAAAKGCPQEQCLHRYFKVDIFGKCPSDLLTYHIKPSFSADMGIVQPLYVAATKCRDATIRRQAIQLLRNSARREAMWDSELCARIGQWIVDIEEDGEDVASPTSQQLANGQLPIPTQNELGQRLSVASSGSSRSEFGEALGPGGNGSWNWNLPRRQSLLATPPAFVREEKRVMVSAVEMDLRAREATIRCGTRGNKKGQFDKRAQSTRIFW
ncbi:hypothetical protein MKZ38_007035 [Zalerion maritima]|uniref:Zn(2)-C6 fungal-type domain-containing protein n=1 Tax=Zalerion maritima TaxID=339359 RepID=A0AAD5WTT2_9PEZI|nr:hypothetical protein MKZ38_007035 [Zalerion maritima]